MCVLLQSWHCCQWCLSNGGNFPSVAQKHFDASSPVKYVTTRAQSKLRKLRKHKRRKTKDTRNRPLHILATARNNIKANNSCLVLWCNHTSNKCNYFSFCDWSSGRRSWGIWAGWIWFPAITQEQNIWIRHKLCQSRWLNWRKIR